jgi:hypothetical protein
MNKIDIISLTYELSSWVVLFVRLDVSKLVVSGLYESK